MFADIVDTLNNDTETPIHTNIKMIDTQLVL